MKKTNLYLPPLLFLLLLNCNNAAPEQPKEGLPRAKAHEINQRLGRGMNIGNTFEAMPSWQSPFDARDMKRIASLGFDHVRIPIRWEREDRSLSTPPYTIYPGFMKTIQAVVDEALKNRLHIIINMHHHDRLYADPPGEKARFLSQWQQIANNFKEYPDSLLFEIMNEPHDKLTADLWNSYSEEALQLIRKSNPERCVLLGTAEWGGIDALQSLNIPDDPNLILTIHYYNPFQFTHQAAEWVEGSGAWMGTPWHDTEYERKAVREDFRQAMQIAKEKDIPLHIGEFGAFSQADIDSRIRWTQYMARWFEQQGFSWAYWEWNASFGIFDPKTGAYHTRLADALLRNPIPEPLSPSYDIIYSSDFTRNNDGWNLYNNDPSASSTVTLTGNSAMVTTVKPGTARWHIQLIREGCKVEQGKTYLARFHAHSTNNDVKDINFNLSKASEPWTSYAGQTFTIDKNEAQYELMFRATESDAQARMVFSMGNSDTSSVILRNIQWAKVFF